MRFKKQNCYSHCVEPSYQQKREELVLPAQDASWFSESFVNSTCHAAKDAWPELQPELKTPLAKASCVMKWRIPREAHASFSASTSGLGIFSFRLDTASLSFGPMLNARATAVESFQSSLWFNQSDHQEGCWFLTTMEWNNNQWTSSHCSETILHKPSWRMIATGTKPRFGERCCLTTFS